MSRREGAYYRSRSSRKVRERNPWMFLSILFAVILVILLLYFWEILSGSAKVGEGQGVQSSEALNTNNAVNTNVQVSEESKNNMKDSWMLVLVNPWNPLEEDVDINLTQLQNGHAVDSRCYSELQEMMDGCREAGNSPLICSSYRSLSEQNELYGEQVSNWVSDGYTQANAEVEAGKVVAVPGTSEHQLGLAVDIVDINYQILDKDQEDTEVQKWLMDNSWRYGFILRYPADKSELTGIIYEPWHYRYVGKDAAKYIYENDICLEEYLEGT